jgi:alpha-tubulin suppressor-like RCC1 family protein
MGAYYLGQPNSTLLLPTLIPNAYSIVQVSAKFSHFMMLTSNNTVLGFGDNGAGQLGCGDYTAKSVLTPVYAGGSLLGKTIIRVFAGNVQSHLVDSNGNAYAFGLNQSILLLI